MEFWNTSVGELREIECVAVIFPNFKKTGWSLGWISSVDYERRTIWIVDAHRGEGKRFIVRADEKRTAFLELEKAFVSKVLAEQL